MCTLHHASIHVFHMSLLGVIVLRSSCVPGLSSQFRKKRKENERKQLAGPQNAFSRQKGEETDRGTTKAGS
ncbi:uncharacterized protein BDV17DRAFT_278238 [Aspergillus undulatus]|uniref:uncharacterized protein n=1 Tax=Aspergillus undulatus TaxID=1810928 RepID=UPI003CCD4522